MLCRFRPLPTPSMSALSRAWNEEEGTGDPTSTVCKLHLGACARVWVWEQVAFESLASRQAVREARRVRDADAEMRNAISADPNDPDEALVSSATGFIRSADALACRVLACCRLGGLSRACQ